MLCILCSGAASTEFDDVITTGGYGDRMSKIVFQWPAIFVSVTIERWCHGDADHVPTRHRSGSSQSSLQVGAAGWRVSTSVAVVRATATSLDIRRRVVQPDDT